jgi:uncharacterized protein YlxP (DUF503 family)
MYLGVARIVLSLHGNDSLKGKRAVVRKVSERIRNEFGAAVSEVEDHDEHRRAVIGVALVGNDAQVLRSAVDRIVRFVDEGYLAPIADAVVDVVQWEDERGW